MALIHGKNVKLFSLNANRELFVFAVNEEDCAYALGRLYQAIVLINYIELQYEEE